MEYDQGEIEKFNSRAHEWWNKDGEFKTLHHINPVRLNFIQQFINLSNKIAIDIGCGGGILTEGLAQKGAIATGIDLAPQSIEIAKLHLYESQLSINYECIDIASKATANIAKFDVLTCMELLEHVSNPNAIIANCNKLLKPGGIAFFSTLNRTVKSYLFGIIGAEYILKLVPKQTHDYQKFIKPAELSNLLTNNGFTLLGITGLHYNPFTYTANLSKNVEINYMVSCKKL